MTTERLPKKTSSSDVDLRNFAMTIYGPPGIGKTRLAAAATSGGRKPLFLWTSPVKYVDAYKIAIPSWRTFTKVVTRLERERPDRYSAVVVDVVDMLGVHCRKEVCEAKGIDHPADLDYGKGWDMVNSEFRRWMAKLCALGYPVIFISHSAVREEKGRVVTTKKVVPTLQGAQWRVIYPICDVVGYMGFSTTDADADESGPRKLFFEPSEVVEAKDWTDRLPPYIVSHRDASKTWSELEAYLTGKRSKANQRSARTRGRAKKKAARKARRVRARKK